MTTTGQERQREFDPSTTKVQAPCPLWIVPKKETTTRGSLVSPPKSTLLLMEASRAHTPLRTFPGRSFCYIKPVSAPFLGLCERHWRCSRSVSPMCRPSLTRGWRIIGWTTHYIDYVLLHMLVWQKLRSSLDYCCCCLRVRC